MVQEGVILCHLRESIVVIRRQNSFRKTSFSPECPTSRTTRTRAVLAAARSVPPRHRTSHSCLPWRCLQSNKDDDATRSSQRAPPITAQLSPARDEQRLRWPNAPCSWLRPEPRFSAGRAGRSDNEPNPQALLLRRLGGARELNRTQARDHRQPSEASGQQRFLSENN